MPQDSISVIDLANQLGKRKQTIFKVLKRAGISPAKITSLDSRGQKAAYVSREQARIIAEMVSNGSRTRAEDSSSPAISSDSEEGYFYVVSCEPDHDPGRIKVGFASNVSERLRHLKVSAPYVKLQTTWPCRRLWEKTAIECVADGCERLGVEVFRTKSIDSVIAKCEGFFSLMPKLARKNR